MVRSLLHQETQEFLLKKRMKMNLRFLDAENDVVVREDSYRQDDQFMDARAVSPQLAILHP